MLDVMFGSLFNMLTSPNIMGLMLIGVLISAHKANWLPKRLFPDWHNGHDMKLAAAGHSGQDRGETLIADPTHASDFED